MTRCEEFIKKLELELPELCSTTDLVDFGIYASHQAAAYARKMGHGPEFFALSHAQPRYPKSSVLDFMKQKDCQL